MKRIVTSALAVGLVLLSHAASAATVSYQGGIAGPVSADRIPGTESFDDLLYRLIPLQKFDPSLGTLTDVDIFAQMKGNATGGFSDCVQRASDCASEFISLTLSIKGIPGATTFSAQTTTPLTCTAKEGTVCTDSENIASAILATPSIAPGDYSLYAGVGTFDVRFDFLPAWSVNARVNSVSAFDLLAKVTYTYEMDAGPEEVPLPASLPLLFAGTIALWGIGHAGKRCFG